MFYVQSSLFPIVFFSFRDLTYKWATSSFGREARLSLPLSLHLNRGQLIIRRRHPAP